MAEDLSRPAFRYPSSGRRPERLNQSRGVNAPLQLLRGWAAGTLGLPGDIEGLVRMLPGIQNETPVLPTSDFYREWLPGYDERPAARAMSGLGALTGGMGATNVARAGLGAVKRATDVNAIRDYVRAAQGMSGMPGTAVIKPKGGNWLEGSVEGVVKPLKRDPEAEAMRALRRAGVNRSDEELREFVAAQPLPPQDAALNKWIDKKLAGYIRNDMGTPEDPVRALAERGVLHFEPQMAVLPSDTAFARTAAGYPRHGVAKSQLATDWEVLADAPINLDRAGDLMRLTERSPTVSENPWLAKVPPETTVYSLEPGSTVRNENLGFGHLVDELRNAVNPESGLPRELLWKYSDLDKVTVPQAVQRVADINKWRAAQAENARLEGMLSADVYKAYPEQDMRWVQLNRPGQFAAESEAMGHSVRGYEPREGGGYSSYGHGGWDAIKEGRAKIYSLRDKRGEPHVTIEVGPPSKDKFQSFWEQLGQTSEGHSLQQEITSSAYGDRPLANPKGFLSGPEQDEHARVMRAELLRRYPELADQPENLDITQIKGKANRAPKEDYLPFVQDFVRSGQWGRVGDIQNTGMRPMREVFNNAELEMLKKAGAELPEHGYLTGEQIQQLHNMVVPEGQRLKYDWRGNIVGDERQQNFARGGAVTAPPGPAQYDPARIDALAAELMAA
jgi:hypothetical protein